MKTSEVLRKALELFGPNGERWSKDGDRIVNQDNPPQVFCAATAISHAGDRGKYPARELFRSSIGGGMISYWNDDQPDFAAIESAFKQAIATAERGE